MVAMPLTLVSVAPTVGARESGRGNILLHRETLLVVTLFNIEYIRFSP
jgi:hypothetical protein